MISRRTFLGAIAAALVADPERALWVPGAKLISIPAPRKLVRVEFVGFEEGRERSGVSIMAIYREDQRLYNLWLTQQLEMMDRIIAPATRRANAAYDGLFRA